jgi:hypothetical protein
MPRTKKPRQDPTPEESSSGAPTGSTAGDEEGDAPRPSQLDQIRAAMAQPTVASQKEVPELLAPEEPLELPAPEAAPELEAHVAEPAEAEAEPASEPAPAEVAAAEPATSPWVPPPTQPPSDVHAAATTARARPSSSLAVGIVLVVLGVFFLVTRLFDVDLSGYGWPLFVIIPGLTLLVVGFVSLGTGALVPGGIITLAGLVLAYQNATGDWASWSYAWALVIPGGVGVGLFLQGLRNRDQQLLKQSRALMFWSLMIFLIGFVLFETVLNVSGIDYGIVGKAALPALLIIIGVTLLARSVQRGRSA